MEEAGEDPGVDTQAISMDIVIEARQCHPSPVSVPMGQQVMPVFTNRDVELHAFVPQQFLE